jgi:hypothetical protein
MNLKSVFLAAFLIFGALNLISQNDLTKKMMMGYQGWFLCHGDNSSPNEWRHWSHSLQTPSAANLHIDMWPDMSEYSHTYNTNMSYADGSNAALFSSHDLSTTQKHFEWMQTYNVHGVYLQRFLGEIADNRFFRVRNNVLQNVMTAAAEYDRHFAMMYDISGMTDNGTLDDKLIADWEYLVDTYDLLNKEAYARQGDKPVVAIWGIGFKDRGLNPSTIATLIDYFHHTADPKYQAYVVGGVPSGWRTLSRDADSNADWTSVYESLDMITPWTVGRYGDSDVDNWKSTMITPDLTQCNNKGVDYMPVIWPGFSWYNLHSGTLNQHPRNGGAFYWKQAYNAIEAGAEFIYVAMFDEVDEATAMFKITETKAELPVEAQNTLVPLDIDGISLPSDWYLQLADETQKMLDGTTELSPIIPISPDGGVPKPGDYLDDCDQQKGWTTAGSIHLNASDQRQGSGCIQFDGSSTMELAKSFAIPYNPGVTANDGYLTFWYYIDNIDNVGIGQVELGSGGQADVNEYNWAIENLNLQNGWNELFLPLKVAGTTGGSPNPSAINWFRIYSHKSKTVKSIIDGIKIVSNNTPTSLTTFRHGTPGQLLVKVYPNRVTDNVLHVKIDPTLGSDSRVELYDSTGLLVMAHTIRQGVTHEIYLNDSMKPGFYFVKVIIENTVYYQKIIKN